MVVTRDGHAVVGEGGQEEVGEPSSCRCQMRELGLKCCSQKSRVWRRWLYPSKRRSPSPCQRGKKKYTKRLNINRSPMLLLQHSTVRRTLSMHRMSGTEARISPPRQQPKSLTIDSMMWNATLGKLQQRRQRLSDKNQKKGQSADQRFCVGEAMLDSILGACQNVRGTAGVRRKFGSTRDFERDAGGQAWRDPGIESHKGGLESHIAHVQTR